MTTTTTRRGTAIYTATVPISPTVSLTIRLTQIPGEHRTTEGGTITDPINLSISGAALDEARAVLEEWGPPVIPTPMKRGDLFVLIAVWDRWSLNGFRKDDQGYAVERLPTSIIETVKRIGDTYGGDK